MRISCGARQNIHSPPTNTLWFKDFAYTGGIPANATRPSFITPPLKTLRYFPLSEGPENCYIINRVPKGHYNVRIFFGLVTLTSFDHEPLFDISVEGTQIYSLKSGWSDHDDRAFAEALVFLRDGTVSICFHSTGHGDPAILSLEILQVDDKAYYFGQGWGEGLILRTATRLSCGNGKPKFDVDYSGDHWGGDRFWNPILSFGQNADQRRSTESSIKQASKAPNFYPEALYQTALVSTDSQPDLQYTMDVDPNRNYSIWLHFAEIDNTITGVGQRVFDILINGDIAFEGVDVVKMSGDRYTALVLNTTVAVNGRTLTVTLHPKGGSHAIINAIEVFEIIAVESKTLPEEGLRGFLPNGISKLRHLQSINLSGNSIRGAIPSSLGTIASLEVLDLSYNFFNGSIPESLGQLTALRRLNLNGNSLSGRVPAALGGRLLHRASFNFTDNAGLCGIPGLRACGPHLSTSAKIGIGFGVLGLIFLLIICSMVWWKRRQNILRAQQIAARGAPYAKARTHLSHDIQLARHYNHHGNARTAAENGPSLLS
ncbi:Receptor-like protein 4 [Citrus sinensis]|nr:Receptor-like protein 4 [Citrus sinensis]